MQKCDLESGNAMPELQSVLHVTATRELWAHPCSFPVPDWVLIARQASSFLVLRLETVSG